MKKITLLSFVVLLSLITKAQIILENDYSNGRVKYVKFQNIGEKYFVHENSTSKIKIYNLDHSLYKTIDIPIQPFSCKVVLLSDKLFDTDNDIEYGISNNEVAPYFFKVYKEDGTSLLNITNFGFYENDNDRNIINTSTGTKLILIHSNDSSKVFSLGGTYLKNPIYPNNQNEIFIGNSYPNPASDYTKIDYKLPEGIFDGKIVIFDNLGNTIKEFIVDNNFDNLYLKTSDLSSGTYFYNLQTKNGYSSAKKMIVVK